MKIEHIEQKKLRKLRIFDETLLKDSSKFKNIPVAPDKDLNYIINSEKKSH